MKRWWIPLGLLPPLAACPTADPPGRLVVPTPPSAEPRTLIGLASPSPPKVETATLHGRTADVRGAAAGDPGGAAGDRGAGLLYRSAWERLPDGAEPPEFVDVRREGHRHGWLYDGGWRIARRGDGAVLEVPLALTTPREPLSFRRFTGGPLPPRYAVRAEARSLGGSTRFNGYGEVAIQVLYLSPTTYVEVLQTDEHLLLWEAVDAPPMQGRGWTRLAEVPNPAALGEWVVFGAEVDRTTGEIAALLDGRVVARARSTVLTRPTDATFTLRATGNREEWRWVEVRPLP